jgi:hypothetical protein
MTEVDMRKGSGTNVKDQVEMNQHGLLTGVHESNARSISV